MPQHATAARSAVGRKIFGLSILSLALFASVPLLLSAPAKSPQDRFGVSEDDRADAVKEANRGWEKVGKAEPRQALDHYLAALKLDPENRAGREGLAALLGMPELAPGAQAPSRESDLPSFPVSHKDKQEAAKHVTRGWKAARQGEARKALDAYLEALDLDPSNHAARQGLVELMPPTLAGESGPSAGRPVAAAARGRKDRDDQVLGRIPDGPEGPLDTKGPLYGAAKPYLSRVEHSADRYGVEPRLVLAVIMVESGFSAHARSSSGARGLMQLLPETASKFGASDVDDPFENIDAGTRYLRYLLDLFKGDVDRSLAAYNSGEMTVVNARGVPPIPGVQRFVQDVKAYYRQF